QIDKLELCRLQNSNMLKRFCLALLFCAFTLPAYAIDYSDMWWLPAESGWGVNFTQNEGVIFMTFFIYGPDHQPTWYVAIAYQDYYDLHVTQASGSVSLTFNYSGGLSCTLSGVLTQSGQLYSVNNASYACSDGLSTNASLSEVKATSLGIEGRFAAPSVALG